MKQDVSPGVVAVIAVILVAIIGFAAYKKFGPSHQPLIDGTKLLNAQGAAVTGDKRPPPKQGPGGNPGSGGGH
jgi:hypothetical protein